MINRTYIADDGNAEIEVIASSAAEAAQEYVDGGDWGATTKTTWVQVYVTDVSRPDEHPTRHRVTVDPDEPDCDKSEHDYRAPHSLVGGIEENPGVQGHGGGVVCSEVCVICGQRRITDSWALCRESGEQGLESVEYPEEREDLEEWLDHAFGDWPEGAEEFGWVRADDGWVRS